MGAGVGSTVEKGKEVAAPASGGGFLSGIG